jgi:hypothetical protein
MRRLQHVVKMDVMLSQARHHSVSPMLVGDGSHATDQPSERARGQGKGSVGALKTLPEKHIASKTEYTNTQQGLPGIGYTFSP